jgi:hypothetical protein
MPMTILTEDVSISHLSEEERKQTLMQEVLVSADIDDRHYSLRKSCAELFSEIELFAEREKVKEQSANHYVQPINSGPNGWMA